LPDINLSTHQLTSFSLHLADNSLIMGHRLSEWAGHGPVLEQDIALSNIALDLIGQSRNFYQYAAQIINSSISTLGDGGNTLCTEDTLAYQRDAHEFKNIILAELSNGDWAKTVLKLFFFSTFQYLLYEKLINSPDKQLSAIAEKSLKEVTYHVRWSSEWVIRLGDGTEESHKRLQTALNDLLNYTMEMFIPADYEIAYAGDNTGIDVSTLKQDWDKKVNNVFFEATLPSAPEKMPGMKLDGKKGSHTEHLTGILSEMQYLQRAYPGCEW
jgi:ring-1,2-phenylacetyl-CoA epoxidase subunit PaaC